MRLGGFNTMLLTHSVSLLPYCLFVEGYERMRL